MRLFEFVIGATRPAVTGTFVGNDLTGATVTCELENLADGTAPFVSTAATITSASSAKTEVSYSLPSAFATAGEYVGRFKAVLSGQTYYSSGFVVRVRAVDRTPSTHPFVYGDGRGGYASVEDVTDMDLNRATRTKITVEVIERVLGDTAVELDRALENHYVVPVTRTQPKAWGYLRLIHKYWAFAGVLDLVAPPSGDSEHLSAAAVWREKGTQLFDDLMSGAVLLSDATAGNEKPLLDYEGAVVADDLSDEVDADHTPIFSVDSFRRNWRLY